MHWGENMATDWTALLKQEIPQPCFERPLVCDGLPDASTVIIIGENPATDVENNWWAYWDDKKGFDYDRFIFEYKLKKPRLMGTRLRFDHIRGARIKAVETNFYRDQGPGGSKRKILNTPLLQTLINNMSDLKKIVFHGDVSISLSHKLKIPEGVDRIETRHFKIEKIETILGHLRA